MRQNDATRRAVGATLRVALACALLLAGAGVAGRTAAAVKPPPRTAAAPAAAIGVNLEGVADWEIQPLFADAIRQGRGWSVPGRREFSRRY